MLQAIQCCVLGKLPSSVIPTQLSLKSHARTDIQEASLKEARTHLVLDGFVEEGGDILLSEPMRSTQHHHAILLDKNDAVSWSRHQHTVYLTVIKLAL